MWVDDEKKKEKLLLEMALLMYAFLHKQLMTRGELACLCPHFYTQLIYKSHLKILRLSYFLYQNQFNSKYQF